MKWGIGRPPQDDDELWWYIYGLFGVKVPRTQHCKDHTTPFQALADAYFARYPVTVWKASRGYGGKSYTLALLALLEAVTLGAETNVLGGSAAQSLNVHNHTKEFWDAPNAPKALMDGEPTKYDTWTTNTGHIRTLMASQNSVRGPHPQRLRLDEIDEMDMAILEAAQGQPMRKIKRGVEIETQTVMSSTHQYPDKTMSAILQRAKDVGWPIYTWCYRETSNPTDGWLTEEEVSRKRLEIPHHMWETEYDLQEPNFEGRAIDSELVKTAFDQALGLYTGEDPVRAEQPKDGKKYVTGIDWAQQRDHTIVATFLVSNLNPVQYRCVAWQKMNRLPWEVMVGRALEQWNDYGGVLVHDATGLGSVVDDLIAERVTPSQLRKIKPVVMRGGDWRGSLYSEYVAAIERADIKYPRIEYPFLEHLYVTEEDLYKSGGHPPDSIVAAALAWKVRPKRIVTDGLPTGIGKESAFTGF